MLRNCVKSRGRDSRSRKLLLNMWWKERCKKDTKITFENKAGCDKIYSTTIFVWERSL